MCFGAFTMDECIQAMNTKLKLTEREAAGVFIDKGSTDNAIKHGELCLVGKLFANRFFGGGCCD